MSLIILPFASIICVILFFGISRTKDLLIGYGQSLIEREEKRPTINLYYFDELKNEVSRKNIYAVEKHLLNHSIRDLLTYIDPPSTGMLNMHWAYFKADRRKIRRMQIMLLLIVFYTIGVTIYEQYHSSKITEMLILSIFYIIIIVIWHYSIFKLDRIETYGKNASKDLIKELKYAKSFLKHLKNDCNGNYSCEKYKQTKLNVKAIQQSDISNEEYTAPITVIIPIYNIGEQYLKECIDSVVGQTMKDIQIICVNDGSTDNSIHILKQYANRDKRIQIINKSNEGLGKTRNTAFPHIKGKYVLFVDADDWLEIDACEKLYDVAENTNAQLVQFFFYIKNESKHINRYVNEYVRYKFYQDNLKYNDEFELADKISNLPILQCFNKLWRTSFLRDNNLCFENILGTGEDIVMSWKGIVLAETISVLPEKLYYYRYRETSISHKQGGKHIDILDSCNKIYDFLIEQNLYDKPEYRNFFLSKKLEIYYRFGLRIVSKKDKKAYQQKFSDSLTDDMRDFYYHGTFKKYWFKHL